MVSHGLSASSRSRETAANSPVRGAVVARAMVLLRWSPRWIPSSPVAARIAATMRHAAASANATTILPASTESALSGKPLGRSVRAARAMATPVNAPPKVDARRMERSRRRRRSRRELKSRADGKVIRQSVVRPCLIVKEVCQTCGAAAVGGQRLGVRWQMLTRDGYHVVPVGVVGRDRQLAGVLAAQLLAAQLLAECSRRRSVTTERARTTG